MSQSELIEFYMEALMNNPDAMPPLQLDAETAHIIRALVVNKRHNLPDKNVQDRVWNQVLFGLYATKEDNFPEGIRLEGALPFHTDDPEAFPAPGKIKRPHHTFWTHYKRRAYAHSHRAVMFIATIFTLLFFSGLLLRTVNLEDRYRPTRTPNVQVVPYDNLRFDPGDIFNGGLEQPINTDDDEADAENAAELGFPYSIRIAEAQEVGFVR